MVVGAGVGGLACAIDLARQGFAVTVVERAATPGGKMRELPVGEARIDAGPTVFTMRWVFDSLFADAGVSLAERVGLTPASILARHAWSEGERLDLFADDAKSAEAIGEFAGAREAAGYLTFRRKARRTYETLRDSFMTVANPGPVGLAMSLGPARSGDLMAIRPFQTLWGALSEDFADARLRQLFGRYATYCGSSPFEAPATLMLVAHVEQEGVWLVEGGMQRLAEAMARLATELGVSFRYGAHAERIGVANGRAASVHLAGGERLQADWIVVNGDPTAVAVGAFGPEAARACPDGRPAERSLSAITWAMTAKTSGFPLSRHNVFFSGDYQAEFREIFQGRRPPTTPTVYVCAQDRAEDAPPPDGAERLLILINAPANGDRDPYSEEELEACRTRTLDVLSRRGLELEPTGSAAATPATFNALFPGPGGALYGGATHGWAAAFKRPGARTRLPGLYLAGGATHPGAGVPMAALSGRLAARRILKDRASMPRFRPGATPGGTSTP